MRMVTCSPNMTTPQTSPQMIVIGLLVKAKVSDMCLSTCCQARAKTSMVRNMNPKNMIHRRLMNFSLPASLEKTPCMELMTRLR